MPDATASDTSLTAPLTVWVALLGAVVTICLTLGAAGWVWTAALLWLSLTLLALLSQTDPVSRAYISGTLRKSNFTQIYTVLARRALTAVWTRSCDPVADTAAAPQVFRAALTWRLYDSALLIAEAYPILLLVGGWLIAGQEARLGSVVVISGTGFWDVWPERIVAFVSALILALGIWVREKSATSERLWVRRYSNYGLVFFGSGIVVLAGPTSLIGSLGLGVAIAGVALAGSNFHERLSGSVALVCGLTAGLAPLFGESRFGGIAILFLGFTIMLREAFGFRSRFCCFVSILIPFVWVECLALFDWHQATNQSRAIFLFLAVLPLINAIFDVISYATTLTLIRLGLRARLPFLYGLYDLAFALVLFLALGATLTATIAAMNALSGVTLLDLNAMFSGIKTDPGLYWWLYAMVFLTILPTAIHFAISLLGLQGLTPKPIRRTVAGWISGAGAKPSSRHRRPLCAGADLDRAALRFGRFWLAVLAVRRRGDHCFGAGLSGAPVRARHGHRGLTG